MDKPRLIIKLPELDDNALAGLQNFLQELMMAFDAHYFIVFEDFILHNLLMIKQTIYFSLFTAQAQQTCCA